MDILLFLLSFVIILAGCEFFTNGVEWAGKKFHLSEGAVGSVLAAVGTAMPETIIPIIAILFMPSVSGSEEIGVGAILGAPFMLATLALFICGIAVYIYAKKRGTKTLHVSKELVHRDLKFFLLAYSIAAFAAFLPADMHWARYILGAVLIPIYIVYVWYTLKTGESCENDEVDTLYLCRLTNKMKLRGGKTIDGLSDPVERKIDEAFREREPSSVEIIFQVIAALLLIIIGANLFVTEVESLAEMIGVSALVLSMLIVPIATELPEKFNSFMWIREGKDTFAIGNITGAMVFQSCIPVMIGVILTGWTIDLSKGEDVLKAASIFLALISASILYIESTRGEIKAKNLMLGGVFYTIFVILVLMYA